ncbi:hypothetical protein IMSAGC022_00920 [Alistipes sp.]|nr:hypothetical protein IMSAGC022_00920 [Alistipes sp.]
MQPLAGGQRRIVAPRRGVERHSWQHVARLLQERAAHRLRYQRRALPHVDGLEPAPPLRQVLRRRIRGSHLRHPGMAEGTPDRGRDAVARAHGTQRASCKTYPQALQRPDAGASGIAAPNGTGHRKHQARRADHRLRPPLRHLQARISALYQSRPSLGHSQQQGAPRAVHLRG